jgi:hypothetical protein
MTVLRHVAAPAGVAPGRGYSQVVTGRGRLVVVSGQIAQDSTGELVGPGDPAAQARQVFENLGRCLAEAGAGFGDVVKRRSSFSTSPTCRLCAKRGTPSSIRPGIPPAPPFRWRRCSPRVTCLRWRRWRWSTISRPRRLPLALAGRLRPPGASAPVSAASGSVPGDGSGLGNGFGLCNGFGSDGRPPRPSRISRVIVGVDANVTTKETHPGWPGGGTRPARSGAVLSGACATSMSTRRRRPRGRRLAPPKDQPLTR